MDPLSLAGLGLSVASLAIQLFSGCIQGYQIFLDVVDMPQKFKHLQIRLSLEQVRLLSWGEQVGLLADVMQEPSATLQLHRNLILDILCEVQRLFKDCLEIETKFNTTTTLKSGESTNLMIQAADSSGSKKANRLLSQARRILERSTEVPKKIEWAMIKQNKFEGLVEELIRYNDSVVSLLDRVTIQEVHTMQVQSQMIMLQLSSQIDDLRQLARAMQVNTKQIEASTTPAKLVSSTSSTKMIAATTLKADTDLMRLANFKADRLLLDSDATSDELQLIDRAYIQLKGVHGGKQLAIYRHKEVWIEWKEYDQHCQVPSWDEMIESRVKKLAALLSMGTKPPEFLAPICLGCFHDVEDDTARYGLIYEIPDASTKSARPRSLLNLLKGDLKPSLTQRIKFACVLANSIMYLHSVNWLHKGIRSDNIVLFGPDDQQVNFDSTIVSGFEYARPDLPNEMTEKPREDPEHDIYRHPHALTRPDARSQKSWDIYSLGIILIEIAFWKSIDTIIGIDLSHKSARMKARKVRNQLLEPKFLNEIGFVVGDSYQNAVHCCIKGVTDSDSDDDVDESDPKRGAELMEVFARDVVDILYSIRV